jgi:hypothetical protein
VSSIRALFVDLVDTLCDETGSVAIALETTSRFVAERLGLKKWQVLEQCIRV